MKTYLIVACCLGILFSTGLSQDPGRFSGLFYFDYAYNIARDPSFAGFTNTALTGPKAFQAFQFRRIYFTYDYDFTETFSTRFRLEADQVALASDGRIGTFVKDAYLRWKNVFGASDLFLGIQPTPAFEVSESMWGYRSLEKTIMDLRSYVGSRDFGAALRGKLDEGGMFGYWVMFANGSGNRPEADKYKRYYAHLQIKPINTLTITVYGDLQARPMITNPYSTSTPQERVSNSITTAAAFFGYAITEKTRVGVEGTLQSTANGFNTGTALKARGGMGISVFAVVGASDNMDVVARYDYFDPNTESVSKGDSRGYILAALAWKVAPSVSVIPNVQVETYEQAPGGPSLDASVTGRLTVAWNFP